jgi:hypothetical protein
VGRLCSRDLASSRISGVLLLQSVVFRLLLLSGNKAKQPVHVKPGCMFWIRGPRTKHPVLPFLAVDRPGGRQNSKVSLFPPKDRTQVSHPPDYMALRHTGSTQQPPCTCHLWSNGVVIGASPACRSEKAWKQREKSMENRHQPSRMTQH